MKFLSNFLKIALAAGLLYWLVSSGKLNWELLSEMRRYPHRLLMAFGFFFVNVALITWRWRYLLSARSTQVPGLGRLSLVTWIGQFFSVVLPGSVTGDFVKVYYVRRFDKSLSVAYLLFSCLVDRVMGLTGLIIMMGAFSLANYGQLVELAPALKPLLHFNFGLLAATATGLVFFFLLPGLVERSLGVLPRVFGERTLLQRLSLLWQDLRQARKKMGMAILISVCVQLIAVVVFHLLVGPQYQTDLSLGLVLSFIPLGFMAIALPIAPGGLGVGHAAFQTLFAFAGEDNGANFFNMYFVVMMSFNLLGGIPWLLTRETKASAPA